MSLPVLVVFGGTGSTGSHALRKALDRGDFTVRALVRTPSKVPNNLAKHPNLEIVQGDITDAATVEQVCIGAKYVMSFAGNAAQSKKGPLMVPFAEALVNSCQKHGVTRLLYQAGGMSPVPGAGLPMKTKIMRGLLAGIMGISAMIKENDSVLRIIDGVKSPSCIGTRPGMLKEMPSKGAARAVESMPGGPLAFEDLAEFSLQIIVSGEQDGKFPLVGY